MSVASGALAQANRRGILCMSAAMACFVINDAFIKIASATLPSGQMIFMRSLLVGLIMAAVIGASGATVRLRDMLRGQVALRALIDASSTLLYLAALVHLPIANATAITLATPIFMALLAMLFLREQVGLRGWIAVIVGFCGVVLVIQPRADGFNVWALVALAATLLHAVRDLMTRRIAATIPSILITLASAIAVCLLSGAIALTEGWRAFGTREVLLLVCAALFVAAGYYLIVVSFRHGDIAVISPFRYTALLVALLLGYFLWGDIPNLLAWCGIALLIGAGLYVILRERWLVPAGTDARAPGGVKR